MKVVVYVPVKRFIENLKCIFQFQKFDFLYLFIDQNF